MQRGQRGENERGREEEEEGVDFGQRMNSHIRKHVIPAMAKRERERDAYSQISVPLSL